MQEPQYINENHPIAKSLKMLRDTREYLDKVSNRQTPSTDQEEQEILKQATRECHSILVTLCQLKQKT